MSRVRRVESRRELERSVDEFITRGYSVKSEGETSVRLKENDWGDAGTHLVIAGLTVWWTLGLGNALYAIYGRVTAEEIVIRIDDPDEDTTEVPDEDATGGPSEDVHTTEEPDGDVTKGLSRDTNATEEPAGDATEEPNRDAAEEPGGDLNVDEGTGGDVAEYE